MYEISEKEIRRKIEFQNPWWGDGAIDAKLTGMTPRAYLKPFYNILKDTSVRGAIALLGPRRIGKTVMIYHSIQRLIDIGIKPLDIVYIPINDPSRFGTPLEKLLEISLGGSLDGSAKDIFVFFDEIQYLKDWERHLKALAQQYSGIRFIACGSAASALRLKSADSGDGSITDFILPPLAFYEYLMLSKKGNLAESKPLDIRSLNNEFINYINYGGYPEAVCSREIQADPGRFIRSDVIERTLLNDLPGLYGIGDAQELNRLFITLAYNTANEVSFEELAKKSGVVKPTIRRYLEYLEAAFLIKRIMRIDENARKFKRDVTFKVHLANPSMRCALFGPVSENDESARNLVETALISQLLHSSFAGNTYYARWGKGEVDIVVMHNEAPNTCIKANWSDNFLNGNHNTEEFIQFADRFRSKGLATALATRTLSTNLEKGKGPISCLPASYLCYTWGKDILEGTERLTVPDGKKLAAMGGMKLEKDAPVPVPIVEKPVKTPSPRLQPVPKISEPAIRPEKKEMPVLPVEPMEKLFDLTGEWERPKDGQRVRILKFGDNEYKASISQLGSLAGLGFKVKEHTWTIFREDNKNIFKGEVKWRWKSGKMTWRPAMLVMEDPGKLERTVSGSKDVYFRVPGALTEK